MRRRAEEPTAPLRLEVTISHRHPAVQPPPDPELVTKEAEQAVRELEARQRDDEALRQSIPKPSARPDLNYDVWSGIQSRGLTNTLRR